MLIISTLNPGLANIVRRGGQTINPMLLTVDIIIVIKPKQYTANTPFKKSVISSR